MTLGIVLWIFIWMHYILPFWKTIRINREQRRLADEAFWNWKPEICDEYYHKCESSPKVTHNYFTRSKAKQLRIIGQSVN